MDGEAWEGALALPPFAAVVAVLAEGLERMVCAVVLLNLGHRRQSSMDERSWATRRCPPGVLGWSQLPEKRGNDAVSSVRWTIQSMKHDLATMSNPSHTPLPACLPW